MRLNGLLRHEGLEEWVINRTYAHNLELNDFFLNNVRN